MTTTAVTSINRPPAVTIPSYSAVCNVNWLSALRTIQGFGASSQQVLPQMTAAQADFLFDPVKGIGLSWIRSMISSYSQSTLSAPATAGATSISVTDISNWPQPVNYTGSNLPTPPYKMIVGTGANLEIVKVTAVSGTTPATFTVTRAQNGTSAVSHSSGALVTLPTSAEITSMQQAQARGAKVYCLPWSPPGGWKSNGSNINGGALLTANYADMAWLFQLFVENMAGQGVTVNMLSVQNEPDVTGTYETNTYTAAQYDSFLQTMAPQLAAAYPSVLLGLPEKSTWLFGLADTALGDSPVLANLGFLAGHRYGADPINYPTEASGHPSLQLWETEWTPDLSANGYDKSMNGGSGAGFASGITVATEIYNMLTTAKLNGWMWWWLKNDVLAAEDNEGLLPKVDTTGGNFDFTLIAKRTFCVGHWSKFVRPGWVILPETDTGEALYNAFRDPNTGDFAVVAVNSSGSPVNVTFDVGRAIQGGGVTPWITDSTRSLAQQTPAVAVGSKFSYTLPATSVMTFYGRGY